MSENILQPTSSIPESTSERLKVREKIGFAFGDAGLGLTNQFILSFYLIYLTDVASIPAASAGTLFLVARLFNGLNDPLTGYFMDNYPINLTGSPFEFLGPTRFLALAFTGDFVVGNLNNIWNLGMDFFTPTPYNNQQSVDLFVRTSLGRSNYHGMFISVHRRALHGLTFDANYTLSKSLDQIGQTQGAIGGSPTQFSSSFNPDIDYGPSDFDARHLFNVNAVYELPFGPGRRFRAGHVLDKLIGGWHIAGIFQAQSGFPLTVTQGFQVFGAGAVFGNGTGAIPLGPTNFGNEVHGGVLGSGGIGTAGSPSTGGTGLNLFADPEKAFNSFRRVQISKDGRSGRGVLRGFPRWQLDVSIGKTAKIREQMKLGVTFDFFNVFNHVNFVDPVLNLNNTSSFGVVTSQLVNSIYKPRTIQVSARFEF